MSNEINIKNNHSIDESNSDSLSYLNNPVIKNLPRHLKQFIIDQNYDKYTPIDHAVWRYIMRQNYNFLKTHAHESYIEGLLKTGISIEHIPSIEQMNKALGKIGWAAVPVDGFIPPAAFMEFQSFRVLVITADIRQLEHIEYTPAPDIVHEAAGHAPIIADYKYAEYLRLFGEIGSKAMSSKKDYELYEAIRHLSIIKETTGYDSKKIEIAEKDVEQKLNNLGNPSEMAFLSRLHWWTVEYGLVGELDNPKLYGAGLLSSIGESSSCLKDDVKKIKYSLDTANFVFDITTKQPHLFVTPDFDFLSQTLNKFADSMAFRTGGIKGINKAIECENVSTAILSSGLQVSGQFSKIITNQNNELIYFHTSSPSALACANKELENHGKDYHSDGFGSPLGNLTGSSLLLEDFSNGDLAKNDISINHKTTLEFTSGVVVDGTLKSIVHKNNKLILLSFSDCVVTYKDQLLFEPSWGTYDMAVGMEIVSVICGAADKDAYNQISLVARERTFKSEHDKKGKHLQILYSRVRECREGKIKCSSIEDVWTDLKTNYPNDWLLALEILELATTKNESKQYENEIREYLNNLSKSNQNYSKLITEGLNLIS